jgi:hypothetical protein
MSPSTCCFIVCLFSTVGPFTSCLGLLGHLQVCACLLVFKESASLLFSYVVALCVFLVCGVGKVVICGIITCCLCYFLVLLYVCFFTSVLFLCCFPSCFLSFLACGPFLWKKQHTINQHAVGDSAAGCWNIVHIMIFCSLNILQKVEHCLMFASHRVQQQFLSIRTKFNVFSPIGRLFGLNFLRKQKVAYSLDSM